MYDRKLVLEQIKSEFSGEAEIHYFDSSVTFAYLERKIMSNSCFSEKRIFIVTEFPEPTGTKQTCINHFKKLMEAIPDGSLLIFYGIEPDDEKALFGHVKKIGKIIQHDLVVPPKEAASWVISQFAANKKTISEEDAQKMVDLVGFDQTLKGVGIDLLRIAVEKVCLYVDKRKQISTDDVLVNSFPSEEFVIWSIYEAMDTKDFTHCMNVIHHYYNAPDQEDELSALNKLLYIIHNRFKCLFYLKEAAAKGLSTADISKDIGYLVRMKHTGIGFHTTVKSEMAESTGQPTKLFPDFTLQKDLIGLWGKRPTIELYTRKEILRILRCVEDSFTELRLRTDSNLRLMIVDVLMLTVCGLMDDNLLQKIRISDEL